MAVVLDRVGATRASSSPERGRRVAGSGRRLAEPRDFRILRSGRRLAELEEFSNSPLGARFIPIVVRAGGVSRLTQSAVRLRALIVDDP